MKFKIGDKVKLKNRKGSIVGVVAEASAHDRVSHGIFKVPIKFEKESIIQFWSQDSIELILEPNDILKSII